MNPFSQEIIIPLGLLMGALVHGLAGFGFALVAVPLLALIYPLRLIVPLVALNGLVINLALFGLLRRHFRPALIKPLLLGALPGIVVGVVILKKVPEGPLRWLLALVLGGYGLFGLFSPHPRITLSPSWGYFFGLIAGALGAALNTPGPPVVIYISLSRLKKEEMKVALQGFFAILGVFVVGLYLLGGLISSFVWRWFLLSLPLVALGLVSGQILFHRLGETAYRRLIFGLLVVLGLMMIPRGN
ncbi:hypothetical protein HNQ76_000243 [Thermosulfuriphilus ammonigenes]|nr:sulfite exporter TauE/SafE family protein [Thermosulfuriphilus ammonigenes]MBA2847897.1 hypothetical protein [Thermosulfuriphilus ammonigenes]